MSLEANLPRTWSVYVPLITAGMLLAYGAQIYFFYASSSDSVSVGSAIRIAAVDILGWAILSPAIVGTYSILEARTRDWGRASLHVAAAFGFAVLHTMLDGLLNTAGFGPFPGSYTEFLGVFLADKLFTNLIFYIIIVLICVAVDYRYQLARMSAKLETSERGGRTILLNDGHRRIRLPSAEIIWLEAAKNYVGVHVHGATYITRDTLSRLEKLLDDEGFVRIHRGVIIHPRHVTNCEPLKHGDAQLTLCDGSTVRLSRRFRSNLPEWPNYNESCDQVSPRHTTARQ